MARLMAGTLVGWMLLAGGALAQEDLQDSLVVEQASPDSLWQEATEGHALDSPTSVLDSSSVKATIAEWESIWADWLSHLLSQT